MRDYLPYPSCFPDEAEERFIKLILSSDAEFPGCWEEWKRSTVFDDIDQATLRLLPLLDLRLRTLGMEDSEISGRIRGVYKLVWLKNQRLLEEVRRTSELCQEAGIPILLLKGLSLLMNVYGDTGARFVGDGDILIHFEDLSKMFELLESHGWKGKYAVSLSAEDCRKCGFDRAIHAYTFRNDEGMELDLHWRAFHISPHKNIVRMLLLRDLPALPDQNTDQWQHSVAIKFKGTALRMLSLEDTLIHVIEHGAIGNPNRPLRWVADAAHIIRKGSLDWDRIMEIVRESGLEIHARLAFRYLDERVQVAIPSRFMKALEQLPLTPKAIKDYYRVAELRPAALGGFPILWYIYWKRESSHGLLAQCAGLPRYLRDAWEIEGEKSIRRYIFEKFRARFGLWLRLESPRHYDGS